MGLIYLILIIFFGFMILFFMKNHHLFTIFKRKNIIYVASPYSHEDHNVSVKRFEQVTKFAAWLVINNTSNNAVFAPITMSHPMQEIKNLPKNWEFWEKIDKVYLAYASVLIVFCLPGWETSIGVQAELKIAKKLKITIWYVTETPTGYSFSTIAPKIN